MRLLFAILCQGGIMQAERRGETLEDGGVAVGEGDEVMAAIVEMEAG